MKKWFTNILDKIPAVTKYILVGLLIAFISFLFPNDVKFKYEYGNGELWNYDDLKSPFNFAIRKSNAELQQLEENIKNNFASIYIKDQSVAKEHIKNYSRAFERELNDTKQAEESLFKDVLKNPKKYKEYGKDLLERFYKRGIIDKSDQDKSKSPTSPIIILDGGKSSNSVFGNHKTLEQLRNSIADSLHGGMAESEFLLPILPDFIHSNLFFSDSISSSNLNAALKNMLIYRGKVTKDEQIIMKGGLITDEVYQKLLSLEEKYVQDITKKKSAIGIFFGYLLLTCLIIGVFLFFLKNHSPSISKSPRQLLFILMWSGLYAYLVYTIDGIDALSPYIIPFCVVPIVIKNFYDENLALFTHIVVVLIASFLCSLGYEFTFIQLLAGVVAVLTNAQTRYWSKFFISMLYILGTVWISYFGLSLIHDGTFNSIEWSPFVDLAISVFLTLLAYPLIPLLERVFGFTSNITLVELSSLDKPLLKELSIKAPGTLQHSLQVSNLSEAAASAIGANTLLVKVAALYHDIGKIKQPEHYIENQNNNNPHDSLNSLESAKIIIDHVIEGEKIARKEGLPNILIDFIKTHHGTTRVEYFYRNYKKENPELDVDPIDFTYPGPKPRSKEEAILMIADSLEAACKSLRNPTEASLNTMIDNIISGKINSGQLEETSLSFKELQICKTVFTKLLKSIYHVRLEYPDDKK